MQSTSVHISVIIPTRNRAVFLERTLESLCEQGYPLENFEVRVIDNDSTDQTPEVCEQFKTKLPNLIYHHNPVLGLHAGRHVGLCAAKGAIAVFADDDIRAFPSWLEAISKSFQDPTIALVGGKCLPEYECPPPDWLMSLWKSSKQGRWLGCFSVIDLGNDICEISPRFVYGCNYAIRKEVAVDLAGFHPDGMPKELIRYRGDGETALSMKILRNGYRTLYDPDASIHHLVPRDRLTKEYVKWRAYIQGISDSYTRIRSAGGIKTRHIAAALAKNRIKMLTRLRSSLKVELLDSYWKGYSYHQKEVKHDKKLLAWVLRENYLDKRSKAEI
jgi:glucosyl-dolichyl phosphate glucuronosyltransferase